MLVTDGGQLIRMRTDDIRIAGRSTMGVILFRLGKDEKVVSATCITDIGDDETAEETATTTEEENATVSSEELTEKENH